MRMKRITTTKCNESMRQRSEHTPKLYRRNVCVCVCARLCIYTSNNPKTRSEKKKLSRILFCFASRLHNFFLLILGVDRLWTWSPLSCVHVVNIQCIKIKLKCMIFSLRRSWEKRTNDRTTEQTVRSEAWRVFNARICAWASLRGLLMHCERSSNNKNNVTVFTLTSPAKYT